MQVPYEHKLVDPQNKPEDFKALYASIVHNTDDSAKVPIIVGGRLYSRVCTESPPFSASLNGERAWQALLQVYALEASYALHTSLIEPTQGLPLPLQMARIRSQSR